MEADEGVASGLFGGSLPELCFGCCTSVITQDHANVK